jgi:N-acyl-D-aspartate/D-glutamate deacylase
MSDARIVLRNAEVIDGTGAPRRQADVVIAGNQIVEVAEPGTATGAEVVDLEGLVLAPGFIDCHTHYDAQVLWDPDLTPSSWHGVTTVVMGNCGFGIAPTRPEHRETMARTLENVEGMSVDALAAGIPWTFETFPEYLDAVEQQRTRLNVAVMIGHTPLRTYVLGDEATERAATAEEVAEMRRLVGEALDAGAVGFASSKASAHAGAWGKPVPSRLAERSEIFEICAALEERAKGVVAITKGDEFGVSAFCELSQAIDRPVTYTALGTGQGWQDVVARISDLGGQVWPQLACRPIVFQLTMADPGPLARVPAFNDIVTVPHEQRARILSDPAWRERARADADVVGWPPFDRITVQETEVHADLRDGPTLAELAQQRGVHPLDVMCDIALADNLRTRFRVVLANADYDELGEMLREDRLLLGLSDAGAHASQLCDAVFSTYLLQHWVRETNVLSLEKAVWRLTGHPASIFGLAGRGTIAPGNAADLVAFDPDAVAVEPMERVFDFPAGADRLVAASTGIEAVWINGVATRVGGKDVDGARPGRLLRS